MQEKVDQLFKEAQAENYGKEKIATGTRKRKRGHDEDVINDQNRYK